MNENFEPTILPFNKNSADESKMIYESINISKPLIDNLCTKENLKSSLCLLSAVAITLTKYINRILLVAMNGGDPFAVKETDCTGNCSTCGGCG